MKKMLYNLNVSILLKAKYYLFPMPGLHCCTDRSNNNNNNNNNNNFIETRLQDTIGK